MGLPASIFRSTYRSTMNVFNDFDEVTLINVDGPFDPSPKAPPAMLVAGNAPGTLKVVPVKMVNVDGVGTPIRGMMGGGYVATSDSRFSAACEKILGGRFYGAVALHDRVE